MDDNDLISVNVHDDAEAEAPKDKSGQACGARLS